MEKILYIHVGFGKTGTTFLQNFFNNNKIKNLYYPNCKKDERHKYLSSIENNIFKFKEWENIYNEIENEFKNNKTTNYLISSEEFFYDKLFISNFNFIKDLFKDYTIKIIITIDNVFNNIYKSYLQFLKTYRNDYIKNNIFNFIKLHKSSFDYKYHIEKFEKLVTKNNIVLIKYTKNNYLYEFLKKINLVTVTNEKEIVNYNKICNKSFSILYTDFFETLFKKNISKEKYLHIVKNLLKINKNSINNIDIFNKITNLNVNEVDFIQLRNKLDFIENTELLLYKEQYKINEIIKYCDEEIPMFRINFNYIVEKYGYNHKIFYENFYTHLFHKFYLNIRKPTDPITYEIINDTNIKNNNKLFCLIHCYNIDKFNNIFSCYIENIQKYFNIIITYSIGINIPELNNTVILKIENRGMDIGGKICGLKYLYSNNINFSNILFIHSKTNENQRKKYFDPLIKNENIIKKNIELLNKNDALLNNIRSWDNVKNLDSEYISNKNYHKEILNFLNIKNKKEIEYCEGNCLYLSQHVTDFIFKENLTLFYNICNKVGDFDLNWVKNRYNKHFVSSEVLYSNFLNNAEYMNLNKNNIAVGNNLSNTSNDMPDGMFEHIFERIYINIMKHLNLKYKIL